MYRKYWHQVNNSFIKNNNNKEKKLENLVSKTTV